MADTTDPKAFEPHPNPTVLAPNIGNDKSNSTTNTTEVDYTPHPPGIELSESRQKIVRADLLIIRKSGKNTEKERN